MDFETVIGLEVHVQLCTASKIFSGASAAFGSSPNTNVDPVVMGMPGSLPVLNKQVVESAIMLGLGLDCEIRSFNRFARKHYFYPDLPKGYQISQFEEPICERGRIRIAVNEASRNIGITRIHMEEDAGKNIHDIKTRSSLVDLNRAGVPLLEVVSEPDLRSPEEASAYLRSIRQIVRYLGVGDGNMEEGSLRCDANISVRPAGETKLGTRTEIKNLNSFRFVEKALEYEVARQINLIKNGEEVVQETRLFDSEQEITESMRGKEGAADYRYFPDPDLPPLVIEESWVRDVKSRMPELPAQCRESLMRLELSEYDAEVLTAEKPFVDYFQEVFSVSANAKASSNWITSELFGCLKKEVVDFSDNPISANSLGTLIKLIDDNVISGKMAKTVFEEMFKTGENPEVIVETKGLRQITDPEEIRSIIQQVMIDNQTQVENFKGGNAKLIGFFVGQVMKATGGSANPKVVNEILREELSR